MEEVASVITESKIVERYQRCRRVSATFTFFLTKQTNKLKAITNWKIYFKNEKENICLNDQLFDRGILTILPEIVF